MKHILNQTFLKWNSMGWVMLAIFLLHTPIANTATINVTANAPDKFKTNSICSLREAIANINSGANIKSDCTATGVYGDHDTINLPAGTYTNAIINTNALEEDENADGDLDILKSVVIAGAGKTVTIIDANGFVTGDRVLDIVNPVNVSISDVTIQGGAALSSGGGIANNGFLTITDCTVKQNMARFVSPTQSGGGISNNKILTMTNTTVSDNVADNAGGGIANTAVGAITISDSTIENNSVASTTNSGGGGIRNLGQVEMTNVTISGNAVGNNSGGGIVNSGTAIFISRNSTITSNTAGSTLGGGIASFSGSVTLVNTIVANQLAGGDCVDISATINASLNNLDSDGTCGVGALSNQDPLLGLLQNNGGPTMTHALLSGSPAIDAGEATVCASAPVNGLDQRGITRPQGGNCDIGAYEKNNKSFFVIPLPGGKAVTFGL